jgi:hypothetical protein
MSNATAEWFDDICDALNEINEAEERMSNSLAYFLGLDLGQAADYSALAILERQARESSNEPAIFHCRHLQRWPLKTPYPQIVEDTYKIVGSDNLQKALREFDSRSHHGILSQMEDERRGERPTLAIDATGVGAPVVDLFKKAFHESQQSLRVIQSYSSSSFGDVIRPPARQAAPLPKVDVTLRAIQITGGDQVTRDGQLTRVPKRDLVSAAQVALQTERLKIAAELPEAGTLTRELQNFQVKISLETAHDSYGAWREGAHDDLVLAVALALWVAQNGQRQMVWA